ncbi:MAG: ECF transporter S component [Actinobacteria bacterium]|nr:ECF transporter S component [Actinomycetota bacterium]
MGESPTAMRAHRDMTTVAIALIPVGIAINYLGKSLAQAVGLPLFLDTIGTMIVAVLVGPWTAAATGLTTNIVYGLTIRPTAIPFGLVNAATGITVGYLARWGWFSSWWRIVVVGVAPAVVKTVLSAPIIVLVFGGFTGSGSDAVTAFFALTGHNILKAVLSTQAIISPTDKILSALIAAVVVRNLPVRLRSRFGSG